MLYVIGFVLSLVLISYSAYKLWKDRAEHGAKGRLWLEAATLSIGFAGALVSLLNGMQGSAKIILLQHSLNDTQNYVVAAEEGRAPRSLTAAQQQIMIRDLQAIQPRSFALYWDASSIEAKRYALQIGYPFQQAKWRLAAGGNKFGVPDYPLFVGYASGQDFVASTVQKAFQDVGLSVHIEPAQNLGPGIAIEIDVGDKP